MTIHTLLSFHPSKKKGKKKENMAIFPFSSLLSWKGQGPAVQAPSFLPPS